MTGLEFSIAHLREGGCYAGVIERGAAHPFDGIHQDKLAGPVRQVVAIPKVRVAREPVGIDTGLEDLVLCLSAELLGALVIRGSSLRTRRPGCQGENDYASDESPYRHGCVLLQAAIHGIERDSPTQPWAQPLGAHDAL